MFSGTGPLGLDGSAWYHPQRLTIDAGAVANGNPNPAQQVLDVRGVHGRPPSAPLRSTRSGRAGGERVLESTRALAQQSGVADRDLVW